MLWGSLMKLFGIVFYMWNITTANEIIEIAQIQEKITAKYELTSFYFKPCSISVFYLCRFLHFKAIYKKVSPGYILVFKTKILKKQSPFNTNLPMKIG